MRGIKLLVGGRAWPPALVRLDLSSLFESGEDRFLRIFAEATAEVLARACRGLPGVRFPRARRSRGQRGRGEQVEQRGDGEHCAAQNFVPDSIEGAAGAQWSPAVQGDLQGRHLRIVVVEQGQLVLPMARERAGVAGPSTKDAPLDVDVDKQQEDEEEEAETKRTKSMTICLTMKLDTFWDFLRRLKPFDIFGIV